MSHHERRSLSLHSKPHEVSRAKDQKLKQLEKRMHETEALVRRLHGQHKRLEKENVVIKDEMQTALMKEVMAEHKQNRKEHKQLVSLLNNALHKIEQTERVQQQDSKRIQLHQVRSRSGNTTHHDLLVTSSSSSSRQQRGRGLTRVSAQQHHVQHSSLPSEAGHGTPHPSVSSPEVKNYHHHSPSPTCSTDSTQECTAITSQHTVVARREKQSKGKFAKEEIKKLVHMVQQLSAERQEEMIELKQVVHSIRNEQLAGSGSSVGNPQNSVSVTSITEQPNVATTLPQHPQHLPNTPLNLSATTSVGPTGILTPLQIQQHPQYLQQYQLQQQAAQAAALIPYAPLHSSPFMESGLLCPPPAAPIQPVPAVSSTQGAVAVGGENRHQHTLMQEIEKLRKELQDEKTKNTSTSNSNTSSTPQPPTHSDTSLSSNSTTDDSTTSKEKDTGGRSQPQTAGKPDNWIQIEIREQLKQLLQEERTNTLPPQTSVASSSDWTGATAPQPQTNNDTTHLSSAGVTQTSTGIHGNSCGTTTTLQNRTITKSTTVPVPAMTNNFLADSHEHERVAENIITKQKEEIEHLQKLLEAEREQTKKIEEAAHQQLVRIEETNVSKVLEERHVLEDQRQGIADLIDNLKQYIIRPPANGTTDHIPQSEARIRELESKLQEVELKLINQNHQREMERQKEVLLKSLATRRLDHDRQRSIDDVDKERRSISAERRAIRQEWQRMDELRKTVEAQLKHGREDLSRQYGSPLMSHTHPSSHHPLDSTNAGYLHHPSVVTHPSMHPLPPPRDNVVYTHAQVLHPYPQHYDRRAEGDYSRVPHGTNGDLYHHSEHSDSQAHWTDNDSRSVITDQCTDGYSERYSHDLHVQNVTDDDESRVSIGLPVEVEEPREGSPPIHDISVESDATDTSSLREYRDWRRYGGPRPIRKRRAHQPEYRSERERHETPPAPSELPPVPTQSTSTSVTPQPPVPAPLTNLVHDTEQEDDATSPSSATSPTSGSRHFSNKSSRSLHSSLTSSPSRFDAALVKRSQTRSSSRHSRRAESVDRDPLNSVSKRSNRSVSLNRLQPTRNKSEDKYSDFEHDSKSRTPDEFPRSKSSDFLHNGRISPPLRSLSACSTNKYSDFEVDSDRIAPLSSRTGSVHSLRQPSPPVSSHSVHSMKKSSRSRSPSLLSARSLDKSRSDFDKESDKQLSVHSFCDIPRSASHKSSRSRSPSQPVSDHFHKSSRSRSNSLQQPPDNGFDFNSFKNAEQVKEPPQSDSADAFDFNKFKGNQTFSDDGIPRSLSRSTGYRSDSRELDKRSLRSSHSGDFDIRSLRSSHSKKSGRCPSQESLRRSLSQENKEERLPTPSPERSSSRTRESVVRKDSLHGSMRSRSRESLHSSKHSQHSERDTQNTVHDNNLENDCSVHSHHSGDSKLHRSSSRESAQYFEHSSRSPSKEKCRSPSVEKGRSLSKESVHSADDFEKSSDNSQDVNRDTVFDHVRRSPSTETRSKENSRSRSKESVHSDKVSQGSSHGFEKTSDNSEHRRSSKVSIDNDDFEKQSDRSQDHNTHTDAFEKQSGHSQDDSKPGDVFEKTSDQSQNDNKPSDVFEKTSDQSQEDKTEKLSEHSQDHSDDFEKKSTHSDHFEKKSDQDHSDEFDNHDGEYFKDGEDFDSNHSQDLNRRSPEEIMHGDSDDFEKKSDHSQDHDRRCSKDSVQSDEFDKVSEHSNHSQEINREPTHSDNFDNRSDTNFDTKSDTSFEKRSDSSRHSQDINRESMTNNKPQTDKQHTPTDNGIHSDGFDKKSDNSNHDDFDKKSDHSQRSSDFDKREGNNRRSSSRESGFEKTSQSSHGFDDFEKESFHSSSSKEFDDGFEKECDHSYHSEKESFRSSLSRHSSHSQGFEGEKKADEFDFQQAVRNVDEDEFDFAQAARRVGGDEEAVCDDREDSEDGPTQQTDDEEQDGTRDAIQTQGEDREEVQVGKVEQDVLKQKGADEDMVENEDGSSHTFEDEDGEAEDGLGQKMEADDGSGLKVGDDGHDGLKVADKDAQGDDDGQGQRVEDGGGQGADEEFDFGGALRKVEEQNKDDGHFGKSGDSEHDSGNEKLPDDDEYNDNEFEKDSSHSFTADDCKEPSQHEDDDNWTRSRSPSPIDKVLSDDSFQRSSSEHSFAEILQPETDSPNKEDNNQTDEKAQDPSDPKLNQETDGKLEEESEDFEEFDGTFGDDDTGGGLAVGSTEGAVAGLPPRCASRSLVYDGRSDSDRTNDDEFGFEADDAHSQSSGPPAVEVPHSMATEEKGTDDTAQDDEQEQVRCKSETPPPPIEILSPTTGQGSRIPEPDPDLASDDNGFISRSRSRSPSHRSYSDRSDKSSEHKFLSDRDAEIYNSDHSSYRSNSVESFRSDSRDRDNIIVRSRSNSFGSDRETGENQTAKGEDATTHSDDDSQPAAMYQGGESVDTTEHHPNTDVHSDHSSFSSDAFGGDGEAASHPAVEQDAKSEQDDTKPGSDQASQKDVSDVEGDADRHFEGENLASYGNDGFEQDSEGEHTAHIQDVDQQSDKPLESDDNQKSCEEHEAEAEDDKDGDQHSDQPVEIDDNQQTGEAPLGVDDGVEDDKEEEPHGEEVQDNYDAESFDKDSDQQDDHQKSCEGSFESDHSDPPPHQEEDLKEDNQSDASSQGWLVQRSRSPSPTAPSVHSEDSAFAPIERSDSEGSDYYTERPAIPETESGDEHDLKSDHDHDSLKEADKVSQSSSDIGSGQRESGEDDGGGRQETEEPKTQTIKNDVHDDVIELDSEDSVDRNDLPDDFEVVSTHSQNDEDKVGTIQPDSRSNSDVNSDASYGEDFEQQDPHEEETKKAEEEQQVGPTTSSDEELTGTPDPVPVRTGGSKFLRKVLKRDIGMEQHLLPEDDDSDTESKAETISDQLFDSFLDELCEDIAGVINKKTPGGLTALLNRLDPSPGASSPPISSPVRKGPAQQVLDAVTPPSSPSPSTSPSTTPPHSPPKIEEEPDVSTSKHSSMVSLGGAPLLPGRRGAVNPSATTFDSSCLIGSDTSSSSEGDDEYGFHGSPFAGAGFSKQNRLAFPVSTRSNAIDTALKHTLDIAGKSIDVLVRNHEETAEAVCKGNIAHAQKVYNTMVFETVAEMIPRQLQQNEGNVTKLKKRTLDTIEKWMFIQARTSPSSLPFVEVRDTHEEWHDLSETENEISAWIADSILSDLLIDTAMAFNAIEEKRAQSHSTF